MKRTGVESAAATTELNLAEFSLLFLERGAYRSLRPSGYEPDDVLRSKI